MKIDSSSCVLPSKLRQRSQSLADPMRNDSQQKASATSNTPNSNSNSNFNYNRLAHHQIQSSQEITKPPCLIKKNFSNANVENGESKNINHNTNNSNNAVNRVTKNAATAKEALLRWCRKHTQDYENVSINNFSSSWSNGLAFCALIHHLMPDSFDFNLLDSKNARYNFEMAFKIAE